MGRLNQAVWERPHSWQTEVLPQGGLHSYPSLDEPLGVTLKIKQAGKGRFEAVVRTTNLQKIMDSSDETRKPRRGKREMPADRSLDSIAASRRRAQQAVRSICMRMGEHGADRMLTFGTREIISLRELLTRFQQFIDAYEYLTGCKWLRCAVPELHKDGVHYHLHVATTGWFRLHNALKIWHALCAVDNYDHQVNGSINVKYFTLRTAQADIPSVIAGYIAKYIGKTLEAEFNKKSYWASRLGAAEITHKILRSKNIADAAHEVAGLLGVNWASVCLTHKGNFFLFPDESGFWFRIVPNQSREDIPF